MKKIFYWSNDTQENSGEGILSRNFLKFLKTKYKNYNYINLNKFKKKNNFLYNYLLPFWGIIKIWRCHLRGNISCYINYLPIWNFFIFLFLPKETILGPITGTTTKKNILYKFLVFIGVHILKSKQKKILFSHDQFKKYFKNKKKYFFNFLFYRFKIDHKISKKKFDLVFYFKKNSNKGNYFLISLIENISYKYKIAVIGDNFPKIKNKINIKSFRTVSRKNAHKIISLSRYALSSKENHYSFFVLDSLSKGLSVFYNKDLKLHGGFKTNMLIPIDFKDLKKSTKILNEAFSKKKQKKEFNFNIINFDRYLAND
tara:strand:+ start:93 stop:1034 length:942 start_codon:yes stop_codon:yes gene_type:complete